MKKYSTKNQGKVPVRADNGHVVGWIIKDTLYKNAKGSRHMLRQPRGWAWDVSILEEAEKQGVTYTEVHDQENNTFYHASLAAFRRFGVMVNRGCGVQICLPVACWDVTVPGELWGRQLRFSW